MSETKTQQLQQLDNVLLACWCKTRPAAFCKRHVTVWMNDSRGDGEEGGRGEEQKSSLDGRKDSDVIWASVTMTCTWKQIHAGKADAIFGQRSPHATRKQRLPGLDLQACRKMNSSTPLLKRMCCPCGACCRWKGRPENTVGMLSPSHC